MFTILSSKHATFIQVYSFSVQLPSPLPTISCDLVLPHPFSLQVNIPNVRYADLSSLRLCSVTKEGGQSDWVTVSVGHETTPFPAQLQGPPLSGSYAQGSLYDSLKLGQSAGSPMVS